MADLVRDHDRAGAQASANRASTPLGRSPSTEELRTAVALEPASASMWRRYAIALIDDGRSDAASEALEFALLADPGELDAVDLLLDIDRRRGTSAARGDARLERMVAAVVPRPELHGAALVLLSRGRPELAEPLVESPVEAVSLAARARVGELESTSTEAETIAQYLMYAVDSRWSDAAACIVDLAPDVVVPGLRFAARCALRDEAELAGAALLDAYLRRVPRDAWATARRAALKSGRDAPEVLLESGFPLGPRRREAAYVSRPRRSIYLLHNSLPYATAGYATRSHGLLRAMQGQGWETVALTRPGFPEASTRSTVDVVDGVEYRRLVDPAPDPRSDLRAYVLRYSRAIQDIAVAERPFVLHAASNHWNGLAAAHAARRMGLPSIYEVRGLWEITMASRDPEWGETLQARLWRRMEADAAQAASAVLVLTRALGDEMIKRGVAPERITVLPNGVDTERFSPVRRDPRRRERLGLGDSVVIGYLGSFVDYEGLDLLIRAFADNVRSGRDVRLLLVGAGAERAILLRLAEELGVRDRLVHVDGVGHADVADYYGAIDIAAFPRRGWPVTEMVAPLKIAEAAASGVAVVASDVTALAECVDDGVNGLLHRKDDVEDLGRALGELIDDRTLRARLGEGARAWASRERDWATIAGTLGDVYSEMFHETEARARLRGASR